MSQLRLWRSELKTPTSLCRASPLLQVTLFLTPPCALGLHIILQITCTPQEAVCPTFLGIPLVLRGFPHVLSYTLIKTYLCSIPYLPKSPLLLRYHSGKHSYKKYRNANNWLGVPPPKKKVAMNYLHFNKNPAKSLSTIRSTCSWWEFEGLGWRCKTIGLLTCISTFMPNYSLNYPYYPLHHQHTLFPHFFHHSSLWALIKV